MKTLILVFKVFMLCLLLIACSRVSLHPDNNERFIETMVIQQGFTADALKELLAQAEIKSDIIEKITKPAEKLAWYQYRAIFLTEARINAGVQFWREHEQTLITVAKNYAVPAEIIVAIIGVETFYGQHRGNYRVIDALNTLAFSYPPRSEFFRKELAQFLLLCREEGINPLQPMGSYAGAMGIPQFMPSSYRHYAADFNQDKQRDIWQNPDDAIASVANYFAQYQWQSGQPIAFPASAEQSGYQSLLSDDLTPNTTLRALNALKISLESPLAENTPIKLLALNSTANKTELWITLPNFYVITRYNHSALYAMAVFQLSMELKKAHG